ncbi:MAG: DUF2341 domain-containing protein, partial [Acidimicrobiia bacterium]
MTALSRARGSFSSAGLRLVAALLSALLFSLAADAQAAWYNSNWQYRKAITINAAQVPSDQTNFPVLISITDTDLAAAARSDGFDILFTDSDELTKLDHEIETYTSGTGALVAWVRVPTLTSAANKTLYLYYGYASAADQQNASGVWNANFLGVWHLKENPATAGADGIKDSTSNANHGTDQGIMDATDQVPGQINGSLDLDGTDDYVQTLSGELQTANEFTVSAWFKADTAAFAHHLVWQGDVAGNGWGPEAEMNLSVGQFTTQADSNRLSFFLGNDGPDVTTNSLTFGVDFTDATNRNFVAVTVTNMSTSPAAEMFLNGSSVASDTGTLAETTRATWNTNLRIGSDGAASREWDGLADEVRISNIAHSANWIQTEYNNQNNPGTGGFLASIGSQETVSAGSCDGTPTVYSTAISTTYNVPAGCD